MDNKDNIGVYWGGIYRWQYSLCSLMSNNYTVSPGGDIHQYLLIPCPGPHWPHSTTLYIVTCSPQHVGHLYNYACINVVWKEENAISSQNFAFLLVFSVCCSFTASDQDNCFSFFWVHFFISMSWGSSALCPTAPLQITTSCTRNVVKLTYFTKHS